MTFTKDNPGLESVLEKARAHQWTPEERRAEMISFACGNVKLHNPAITKEDVERIYDELGPRLGNERPTIDSARGAEK